jgi:hypothetical protein
MRRLSLYATPFDIPIPLLIAQTSVNRVNVFRSRNSDSNNGLTNALSCDNPIHVGRKEGGRKGGREGRDWQVCGHSDDLACTRHSDEVTEDDIALDDANDKITSGRYDRTDRSP